MTSVQTHTVIQHCLPLLLMFVSAIGQPAVGLEKDGWAEIFLAIPPVGGAGSRAAGAENAFVEAVKLLAVGG